MPIQFKMNDHVPLLEEKPYSSTMIDHIKLSEQYDNQPAWYILFCAMWGQIVKHGTTKHVTNRKGPYNEHSPFPVQYKAVFFLNPKDLDAKRIKLYTLDNKIFPQWLLKKGLSNTRVQENAGEEFYRQENPEHLVKQFLSEIGIGIVKELYEDIFPKHRLNSAVLEQEDSEKTIQSDVSDERMVEILENKPKSASGKELRPYQIEDIKKTKKAILEENVSRILWLIVCGLGKSLMSYELLSQLNFRSIFFVTSRLDLIEQIIHDFVEYGYPRKQIYVCCSWGQIKEKDSALKKIACYADLPTDTPYILFTTYDSLPKLKGSVIDMMINDEGHHLVSSTAKTEEEQKKGYLFGLHDANITSKFRLTMTGTPKDAPRVDTQDNIQYLGMTHQPELYGKILAERNYIYGRDNGYLAQFEVICIKAQPTKIQELVKTMRSHLGMKTNTFQGFLQELQEVEEGYKRKLTDSISFSKPGAEDEDNDRITTEHILWYAIVSDLLIQAIQKYGCKQIVTWHTTKLRAELFRRWFKNTWNMYSVTKTLFCETVHSQNSEKVNRERKAQFCYKEGPDVRMLCNVRQLIEGFNVPTIDTSVFVDNKFSPFEIAQAVGRGNRPEPKGKIHRVIIPFMAYETKTDDDLLTIRTTNDYKTIRYTIQNIILSHDPNMTISQTVWVPKGITKQGEKEKEVDPSEKVWIPDDFVEKHDQAIKDNLGQIDAQNLADHPFYMARIWMHAFAKEQKWSLEISKQTWKAYKETHELPKGIPYNPEDVYRNVGWISWEDYIGLSEKKAWSEIQLGEMMVLMRSVNVLEHTLASLRTYVEEKTTRKLPSFPKHKWNLSVYDLLERISPESVKGIKEWGKYPDAIFALLRKEMIRDAVDFEKKWVSLHMKHPSLPGMPTEIWGNTFWEEYVDSL